MKQYVSVKTLGERYEVSPSTIWRWVARGRLPEPERLSDKCTRWNLREIERLEHARSQEVTSTAAESAA